MKRDLSAVIITNLMFSFVYFLPLVVLPLYKKIRSEFMVNGVGYFFLLSYYYTF